jgi:hypothetical protein
MNYFDKFFQRNFFGSLPLKPGIETISLSLFSLASRAKFTFNNSACFSMIEHPSFISSEITFPPKVLPQYDE